MFGSLSKFTLAGICIAMITVSTSSFDLNSRKMTKKLKSNRKAMHEEEEEACAVSRRCNPINTTGQVSFVHISKCAGSSWIKELSKIFADIYPREECGEEWSFEWQRKNIHFDYMFTSLKSPLHHLWKLFIQCKHGGWGKRVTEKTNFPRSGNGFENDRNDFERWLSHFLGSNGNILLHASDYHCYHPANFQTRALAVPETIRQPRGVKTPNGPILEPEFEFAMDNYWQLDWVAIAEFFHESKCVLFHRLQNMDKKTMKYVQKYLDEKCLCPQPDDPGDVYVSHYKKGYGSNLINALPEDVLGQMQLLTTVDVKIFKLSLIQLFKEIIWLESEFGLGRRVLCSSTLNRLSPELAYLGLNVTQLYTDLHGIPEK